MHFGSEQAVNYGDGLPMALLCGVTPLNVDVNDFSKRLGWIRIRHCRACEERG
jgi:hypothetical protein